MANPVQNTFKARNGIVVNTAISVNSSLITLNTATVSANGSVGLAGQVLTTDTTRTYWSYPTTSLSVNYSWTGQHGFTNTVSFSNTVTISAIRANNALGTAGQVLTSNGTSTYWSTTSVNTAISYNWTNTHSYSNIVSFSNTVTISAVRANTTLGTAGQVLTSNGTSTYWSTPSAVDTSGQYNFSNTITFSNTVTMSAVTATSFTTPTLSLSTFNNATNGYTTLPNGFKLYWGTGSTSSFGTGSVTFSPAFINTPYSVTVTPTSDDTLYVSSRSRTGMSIRASGSSNFNWMAIGI
jgi:hypothetical protein